MQTWYECDICENRSQDMSVIRNCENQGYKEPLPKETRVNHGGSIWRTGRHMMRWDHTYSYLMSREAKDNDGKGFNIIHGYTHESKFTPLDSNIASKTS